MCWSRKFCQMGSSFDGFFSWWAVGGSKNHYKRAIIGPTAKRHLNTVSIACWWWPSIECWLGSFVIFQWIWTRAVKKPYILWFFQGGGVRTPCPLLSLYPHTNWTPLTKFPGSVHVKIVVPQSPFSDELPGSINMIKEVITSRKTKACSAFATV